MIGPSIASGAAGWQVGRIAPAIPGQHDRSEYPSGNLPPTRRRRELDPSYSQSHPGTKALSSGVWGGAPELSHGVSTRTARKARLVGRKVDSMVALRHE